MKKLLFLFLISISFHSLSQEEEEEESLTEVQEGLPFAQYSGWSLEALLTAQLISQPESENILPFYGMGVYPRYNYSLVKYYSIAIGAPLNGGIEAASYGSSSASYFKFFADVPLELTLNVGSRATKNANYLFGAYVGGGLGYNYYVFSNSLGNRASTHSFGPMISSGIRYKYFGRPLGIRLSYMLGVINNFKEDPYITYNNSTNPKILSLSIVYGVQ